MRTSHLSLLLCVGAAMSCTMAARGAPVLLKDIYPGAANIAGSSHPISFTQISGGRALFFASTALTGYEPYVTDGTAAGTFSLGDLNPGAGSSVPVFGGGPPGANAPLTYFAVTSNGTAYFFANNGVNGWELFKTDGTAAGTSLVVDLNPGTFSALSPQNNPNTIYVDSETTTFNYRPYMRAAGNKVYFGGVTGSSVPQLYVSDGTAAGTVLIPGYPYPRAFTQLPFLGNKVLFTAGQGVAGTWYVLDPVDNSVVSTGVTGAATGQSYGVEPLVASNRVYFMAQPGAASEIWSIGANFDPNDLSTVSQVTNNSGLGSNGNRVQFPPTIVGTKLFHIGAAAASATELLVTDLSLGTPNTTLIDVNPGAGASFPRWPTVIGSTLYFTAQTAADGLEVWKTNGTAAGTVRVTNLGTGTAPSVGTYTTQSAGTQPMPLRAVGTKIIFSGGSALTGPTAPAGNPVVTGTTNLKVIDTAAADAVSDLNTGINDGYYFTSMGSYILASGTTPTNGRELVRSDGTPAGTTLVKDLNSVFTSSEPSRFTALDATTTIFTADKGTGQTLWKTDGTSAGTVQLGVDGNLYPRLLTSVPNPGGNRVYCGLQSAGYELGFTDGTGVFVFNLDTRATANGQDGAGFPSVIYSGGTPANPTTIELFEETRVGYSADRRYTPAGYADLNGALLFMGQNATSGRELFAADLTGAGLLADIFPGDDGAATPTPNSSLGFRNATPVNGQANLMLPNQFFKFGGKVYFAATDGVSAVSISPFTAGNSELYVTDGTTAGTVLAADINPGGSGSDPHEFCALDANAFLFYARGDSADDELWRADVDPGTGAVTVSQVMDINPSGSSFGFWPLVKSGSNIFFAANDGTNGRELWVTDGTSAGTHIVADLNPGPEGSLPGPYVNVSTPAGDRLFFYANNGSGNGFRFYLTDGTTVTALPELNPGPGNDGGSSGALPGGNDEGPGTALDMIVFQGKVYFPGNDGVHGLELFSFDPATNTFTLEADINPGADSSAPQNFFANGTRLYFSANDGSTGRELYIIDLTPAPSCLADINTDGVVDGTDFVLFINSFAIGDVTINAQADVAGGGTSAVPDPDGTIDGTDFVAFINAFALGC